MSGTPLGCSLHGGVANRTTDGTSGWIECGMTVCGHEPEPRNLLRLIDDAIGTSALCASFGDESDRERFEVEKARLAATRAKIVRRLTLIEQYRGTEASEIKTILATGRLPS
jgi:hypothetical protein